ncbi:hypothetical protein ENKNEFLB_02841 [Nocardioides aquaticus]|uniref:Uncharacterized protein n=1 Tax=Nocardioides aquaticus TaxID=160826 RepID=A0ABX8ELG0_9ACTN|nr:hypothetical protein [Nocardioides aquaticus]QVT80446.1 hypothetical protein ENKNEFLB_02841 [Nocardioides aquaticus]
MTITTHPTQRPTEAICPPWCAGHDGEGYQHWYETDDATLRDHCEDPVTVRCVGVEVCSVEQADRTMRPAVVEIFVDGHDGPADLTPTEARELARLLLDGADRAEAHQ